MKTKIVLMIVLSIFMGVSTNLGWFTLYNSEFISPFSEIVSGQFPTYRILNWCLLLLSHALVVSLFFLTEKPYFKQLLYWFPLLFIIMFTLYEFFVFFLLIPFIIIWTIALFKKPRKASSSVN